MALVYTPLGSDTFIPNANPLNPAKWRVSSGDSTLTAVSGQCQASSLGVVSGSDFIGATPGANQYAKIVLGNFNTPNIASESFDIFLRANIDYSEGYALAYVSNGDGTGELSIQDLEGTTYIQNDSFVANTGDVIIFAVVGTSLYAFQNGVLVLTTQATTASSGFTAIDMEVSGSLTDTGFTYFETGNVSNIMSNTPTAMYSQNSSQTGTTVAGAFPQLNGNGAGPQNLDLLQIIQEGGNIILNVDYQGTVHNPASSPTNGTRIGVFQTTLSGSPSTASLFANAFSNPSQLDILQVINQGGNIHYYLDYTGTAHGS